MRLPSLRQNIAALGFLQVANYLIPLVTVPYLTRTLGVESYGKVAFVQVVMAYLTLLTDFGFSWSATRSIAANREDYHYISRIFCLTWCAQWLLTLFAFIVLMMAIAITPKLQQDAWLYLVGFASVVGNVCSALWLLQGLERMRELAVIQVTGRIMSLPILFQYVSSSADVIFAIAVIGTSSIVTGLISLYWIKKKCLVSWYRPTIQEISMTLREGSTLFFSRVSVSFYTMLAPLALGIMTNTIAVGYFSLAEKVAALARSILESVSQTLLPRMSYLYENDRVTAQKLFFRSLFFALIITGCLSATLWLCADLIILLLGGSEFAEAAQVLRVIAFLPLLSGLSNVFGVQVMLPNRHNKAFNFILGIAGLFGLCIIWPLSYYHAAIGAAQSMCLVELFVATTMGIYLWRKGYLSYKNECKN
jgi:PST family polysaccharide transporter